MPPQRRSGASTAESDCCSTSAALLCCSHWLQQCPSPVTNQGAIGACSPCAAVCAPQPVGSTFACCSHCRSAPVPLPIKGLLEPAALASQPDCCSISAALLCCSHWLQ